MKAIYTLFILLVPFVGFGQLTYVPDDNFEQRLIDYGYDDILDDFVLTENITDIETLYIDNSNIEDLTGIEDFLSLIFLAAGNNNISSIDLLQNINLEQLNLFNNNLSYINLSQNINLKKLKLFNNNLSDLNLSQNINLEWLWINNNPINEINLSQNISLERLYSTFTKLTSLDLSNNSNLSVIELTSNYFLDSLDLRNNNNSNIEILNTLHCQSLGCILIDDLEWVNDNWNIVAPNFTQDPWWANEGIDIHPYSSFSELNCNFYSSLPQSFGSSIDTLSANNIETIFGQRSFCWDLNDAHFEVPKESGKHSIFSQGHWIGGIADDGAIHLSAQTYRQSGSDFYPGPISDSTFQINEHMDIWDRQWKLTKNEIDNHIINFNNEDYIIPDAISSWPAHGDCSIGQSFNLAPFIDSDNNGIYNPNQGDYPCIKGDEAIYMIRNDVGNKHFESGYFNVYYLYSTLLEPFVDSIEHQELYLGPDTLFQENDTIINHLYKGHFNGSTKTDYFIENDTSFYENKIGLEQHLMFYAFDNEEDEALSNTIFVENTLYNRQEKNFSDFMFGLYTDPDLGKYDDDYVGCNVNLDLAYCYNGDDNDEGAMGYGIQPPAIGIKFLDSDMSAFVNYNNDFTNTGNPENPQHCYNYLISKWKDGSDITYGGAGVNGSVPSKYMFPGNSDPDGIGTNGVITSDDWEDPEGWNEYNSGNTPANRRFVQSAGPFTFASGDVIKLNYAFIWSRIDQGDVGGSYASAEKLFLDSETIQDFFNSNYIECTSNLAVNQLCSFNCELIGCVESVDGTGTYSTLEECETNCIVVVEESWNCVNDACLDPLDGSGVYSSLNDCEQECQNVSSINENIIDVNIFPNPSSNIFNLEFNSDSKSEIIVTNILGEKVYIESTQSIGEFNTQIDLSNYSKGIYNLTIKNSDGISNHKLILQ